MPPRRRAPLLTTTPASLALALTILLGGASVAAGRSGTAAHADRRAGAGTTTEAAPAPAAVPATTTTPAPAKAPAAAARDQRRRERAAAAEGATSGSAQPAAQAPAREARPHREPGSLPAAVKRAERALERAASGAAGKARGSERGGAAKGAAAPAARSVPSREQREREREQRISEREERRVREGHKETKRGRELRQAREAREAVARGKGPKPAPAPVTAAAATAAPTVAPATPASTAPPSIAAQHSVRATAGAGARRSAGATQVRTHGSRTGSAPAAAPLTAPAVGAAVASSTAPAADHPQRQRRSGSGGHGSSPIVTTVTRIIGVIPTALWILIGVLAAIALAFAASTRVAAVRARRLARQRRELLEDVGLLQGALLPELPERLGPVGTTAAYRPASGPGAGGDFYDVFALGGGQLAVLVGDVSGHGRAALPHTTLLRFTLRAYLEAGLSPREALRAAAPGLERQLGGYFATVVLAVYDPRRRELTYSCAGHPHPILTGLSAEAPIIAASAPPIGAGQPTGTRQTVVSIPGATVACFYTDGVVEARTGGELYGTERLEAALGSLDGEAAAPALLDLVREQTDRRPDDMAACLIEISGPPAPAQAPEIVIEELELDGREESRSRTRRFAAAAGLDERDADKIIDSARAIVTEHGSALLQIRLDRGQPQATLTHDNVAPLRARAMARTQEVAL